MTERETIEMLGTSIAAGTFIVPAGLDLRIVQVPQGAVLVRREPDKEPLFFQRCTLRRDGRTGFEAKDKAGVAVAEMVLAQAKDGASDVVLHLLYQMVDGSLSGWTSTIEFGITSKFESLGRLGCITQKYVDDFPGERPEATE